jgi:ribosomal-protein-alanine N-acetyltransferase
MNALPNDGLRLRVMTPADLTRVLAVEVGAYGFPWSRGNFIDSLSAGYLAEVLFGHDGGLLGYYVAMPGVDEMHLLNITVASDHQGRGHGRAMLDALEERCRERRLPMLWLEVRAGNHRARAIYRRRGYAEVGLRRGYYPAPQGLREDAIVMSMAVASGAQGAGDGLV